MYRNVYLIFFFFYRDKFILGIYIVCSFIFMKLILKFDDKFKIKFIFMDLEVSYDKYFRNIIGNIEV